MKLLLLGYGKMGKTIAGIAENRGHQIVGKINIDNREELKSLSGNDVDAAIEFSQPDAAVDNILYCLQNGIPVLSGTTGWLDQLPKVAKECDEKKGTFFYASNFSIGVNLFFRFNRMLAKIMSDYPEYNVTMEEIHHTEKKDAPSGTAITLAEGIIDNMPLKDTWVNQDSDAPQEIGIRSLREDKVPGTHTITYRSAIDDIEIMHKAHTREGFAKGAVMVAEWIQGKKGMLGMEDFMGSIEK